LHYQSNVPAMVSPRSIARAIAIQFSFTVSGYRR
jgi:hypothetical protein